MPDHNRLDAVLVEAVKHNNLANVRMILGQGASPNAMDICGWSAAHYASRSPKYLSILLALLHAGANPNSVSPYSGQTPLHIAASHNNLLATKLLLNCGADIWVQDSRGKIPRERAPLSSYMHRLIIGISACDYLTSVAGPSRASLPVIFSRRDQTSGIWRSGMFIPAGRTSTEQIRNQQQSRQQDYQTGQSYEKRHKYSWVVRVLHSFKLFSLHLRNSTSPSIISFAEPEADDILQISSVLHCGICLDTLVDPVTLPCGHSFCLECSEQLIASATGPEFACPLDRRLFSRHISLPVTTTLKDLISWLNMGNPSESR
eukprot:gene1567-4715_t